MSKLFPNYSADLENGFLFNKNKKPVGKVKTKYGHTQCNINDCYGNRYNFLHQVIIAEGLQLPKHLWPVDEKGKRYIVDHIVPVSNGGTNAFGNLHLIPKSDNSKNELSRINYSKRLITEETKKKMAYSRKGIFINRKDLSKKIYQCTIDGKLIKVWESAREAERNGFNQGHICACCRGEEKTHKGFIWKYKIDKN